MKTKRPSKKEMWFFAIGQLGWSILGGLVANLLVNYYLPDEADLAKYSYLKEFIPAVTIIGLTIIGLITAIGRVFDAVTDPIIANFSDNCKHKLGKRIPFLRYSALPFALVTVLCFCATFGNKGLNVAWLAVFLMLYYLFMTAYCTPFNALIPVLGHEQEDRMNLSTYISLTYIVGTGVAFGANMIWSALYAATGWDYYLCAKLVIILEAVIALLCMWVPAFGIKETDYAVEQQKSENPFKSLKKTFSNKHFRLFVVSDILYWIGITIFNTGFLYYVSNLLNCKNQYMLLFIFMTFVTFLFYVPVNKLTQKIGKKKMVVVGFIAFALAFGVCALAGKLYFIPNLVYGFIICVFVGIPLAILGVVPQAIVADIAEQDQIKSGENHDGMFYAARTFAFKLGQGLAMIIFTSLAVICNKYDMVNLQVKLTRADETAPLVATLEGNFNVADEDKDDSVFLPVLNGGVSYDEEKKEVVISSGTYTTIDGNGNVWKIVFGTDASKNNTIEITEVKKDGTTDSNKGTYTVDGSGCMTFNFEDHNGLQIGTDGLGYRLSLLVALGFSILAAVALLFYNEKDVMGTINEAHSKVNNEATEVETKEEDSTVEAAE